MKYEKEIKDLEDKLAALRKAISEEDDALYHVPVCPGCFEDMPLSDGQREFRIKTLRGTIDFDAACRAAEDIGMRLLTKDELCLLLATGFFLEDTTNFWVAEGRSSSVRSSARGSAWYFSGINGIIYYSSRSNTLAVRCVGRP